MPSQSRQHALNGSILYFVCVTKADKYENVSRLVYFNISSGKYDSESALQYYDIERVIF